MPKHGWKCDYCISFFKLYDEANAHEKDCSSNPDNKFCYTCSNHQGDGFWIYGESFTCLKGLDIDHFEDEGHCDGWQ